MYLNPRRDDKVTRILIVSVLVLLLAGCAGPIVGGDAVTGSGKLANRSFELSGFTQIDANSVAEVEVTRGEAFGVEVEVDDNLESRLDVAVRGDTLYVKLQNGMYDKFTLRARVTMPELTGVKLNGASTLRGELAGEDLDLDLNGASRATLTGAAGRMTVKVNGASLALLAGLAAQDVKLDVNGASRVEINASGAVSGKANGASSITVTGSPTSVDVRADGASRVITK
jgi:hypothetical protein